ncbi:MAG: tetratricopeptide repeat protein [candidate division WOR-3 bacterium]
MALKFAGNGKVNMRFWTILSGVALVVSCTPGPKEPVRIKLPPDVARDSAKVWYSIGKDYLINKGNYDKAIENFQRALGYDSSFTDIYVDLGWAYIQKGLVDSAEMAYQAIAKIDPKDTRGWQGLGFMYGIVKKDIEQASVYYHKALELDPNNNDARFGLAKVYEQAGRKAEADSIYRDALANDPENPAINRAYGLFLVDRGDHRSAIPYLEKAYETVKDNEELHARLLESYMKVGGKENLKKALEHSNWLIANDSTKYILYIQRGDIYAGLGKSKDAEADYKKACEIADSVASVYMKMAVFLAEQKRYGESSKLINKALNCPDGDRPEIKGPAYSMLGDMSLNDAESLRGKKKYKESLDYYDRAISYYNQAIAAGDPRWTSYAAKQKERAEQLRLKAWRKVQGID